MDTIVGIISLFILFILMFAGLPIGYSMLLVGVVGISIILTPVAALQIISSDIFVTFSSYTLSVIPLFSLMGYLAYYSGIGENLFNTVNKFVGHRPGGLAKATNLACFGFGAICGSIPATIVTMSSIAYPEMKKYKYANSLSCGVIAASSSLSVLIPPSVAMIVYGIATETSIGRLFAAGIIPGILLALFSWVAIEIMVRLNPSLAPKAEKATWKERWKSVKNGGIIEILIVFIVSTGGLFLGLFTATEAGAVGVASILFVGVIRRSIRLNEFKKALVDSSKLSAMIFILIAGAMVFGRLFALTRITNTLGDLITSLDAPNWLIMLFILLIYFIAGMFVDAFSLILITIPVFFPIITNQLGYDPVWFSIVAILIMSIGFETPPLGMSAFVMKGTVEEVPLQDIFIGIIPFMLCEVILTFILIFFPQVTLWLPNLIYGVGS